MRRDIELAIRQSTSTKHFPIALEEMGYEFQNTGRFPGIKQQGSKHFTRLETLGENYSSESIKNRIFQNSYREPPLLPEREFKRYTLIWNSKKSKNIGGLHALYLCYNYKLGILPKNNRNKPIHPSLREDIRFLDKIIAQSSLICDNRIETFEQLSAFVEKTRSKINEYVSLRKEIQTVLRRVNVPMNNEELKRHKDELTKQIVTLRKQIITADGVKERSERMRQNLNAIKQGELMKKQKEQQQKQRKSRDYER